MKRRLAALAIASLTFVIGSDARAQQVESHDTFGAPNSWEVAKKPGLREDFAVHVLARRLLLQAEQAMHPENAMVAAMGEEGRADSLLSRAFILLSEAIRGGSTDARLRFDLGEVLHDQKREAAAHQILQQTLAASPDGDGAHSAWLTFAFVCSMLDRPDEERAAYDKYLSDETNPIRRAVPLLNLAEANMRGHRLDESIGGYREVEQLSATLSNNSSETGILAVWGLAIALDRQGDARGASEQARIVSRMDPESPLSKRRMVLDSPGVYFVPAYEKFWYQALAVTEEAKQVGSATLAAAQWGRVVALWKAYLEPAERIDHPEGWNAIAKKHLASAEKQLKLAADRAKKEPTPKKPKPLEIDF